MKDQNYCPRHNSWLTIDDNVLVSHFRMRVMTFYQNTFTSTQTLDVSKRSTSQNFFALYSHTQMQRVSLNSIGFENV